MKLSDRDLKLLVVALIAVVIVVPIFFVIKPYNEKIELVTKDITQLSERQSYLAALNQNRGFYLDSIDLLNQERNNLIKGYAEGIRRENTIMFLANTEKSIPITMKTITFTDSEITPISDSYVDEEGNYVEGLQAMSCISTVSYEGEYQSVKDFLKFILNNKEKMIVSTFTALQSEQTGLVEGIFLMEQYAVSGEGRTLEPAKIPQFQRGNENIFGTPKIDGEEIEEGEEEGEEE